MKQENNFRSRKVFPIAVFLIVLVAAYYFFAVADAKPLPDTAGNQQLPMLAVREDTLTSLLHNFFKMHNVESDSKINSSGKIYEVLIKKFGNNRVQFYNNPKLLTAKAPGFAIEVTRDGDIKAVFRRLENKGTGFVEVPTDILFRLLTSNEKPDSNGK